jgi:rhodanese-related sulfurtransferase
VGRQPASSGSNKHGTHQAFRELINDAKSRINEMTVAEFVEFAGNGERFILVDVREDHEWLQGRIPGAVHIGKGIIERDIERHIPDKDAKVICYCAGGYRSAIVCDNLQRMGYKDTISLDGGIRVWVMSGHAISME